MGSWDYKKAFDSPAKSILILAWIRAGIPRSFAEYIVGMDIGGKIIVKTDYAQSLLKNKGYKGLVNMGGRRVKINTSIDIKMNMRNSKNTSLQSWDVVKETTPHH